MRRDDNGTLYVRCAHPAEYEAGHIAGAISLKLPGGQLVQATDQYIGTLGARVVLADDLEVRAAMTGSWLRQMGFAEVFLLAEAGNEAGGRSSVLETKRAAKLQSRPRRLRTSCCAMRQPLCRNYLAGHIPAHGLRIRTATGAGAGNESELALTSSLRRARCACGSRSREPESRFDAALSPRRQCRLKRRPSVLDAGEDCR